MRKRILVLGSTGSVGRNVLDVVSHHPSHFEIVGLAGGRNTSVLAEQCAVHPEARFAMCDAQAHERLAAEKPELSPRCVGTGDQALVDLIDSTGPDLVVNSLVGFVGLKPTLHALERGISVALANKEAVVTGGELLKKAMSGSGASVIPIDSEHVAISQCLRGCEPAEIKKVYITASGGALRDRPLEDIDRVTREEVLAHPTWDMGDKITVDSATLLNKGLEVIEAHWLFDLSFEKIGIVIHPQSIIHSLVEFRDNSIMAQMGLPDMRLPILYALTYPERVDTDIARSSVPDFPDLSFREVEAPRYPCLDLALRAGEQGGNAPTILNSANEIAVGAFLADRVSFPDIYRMIDAAMEKIPFSAIGSFDDVRESDLMTREFLKKKFAL